MDFTTWEQTRKNILNLTNSLTVAQLNTKPQGFNNTLGWNLGHVVVTQQLLVYKLAGRPLRIDQEMIDRYRQGTQPEADLSEGELSQLKHLLMEAVAWASTDLAQPAPTEFQEYPTSYGVTLHSQADAFAFNTIHEGLHLGYMMAMRKLV